MPWLRELATPMKHEKDVEAYIQMAANEVISRQTSGIKKKQVYLQEVMQLTRLTVQRYQSGFQIMYLQITVQELLCVYLHMMTETLNLLTKFNIPIIQVIAKDGKEIENMTEAYTEAVGTMINSGEWNGMESSVLKKEAPAYY